MTTENNSLIKLQGIQKIYLTEEIETWALNNINLEISEGEYVSISGPSGCGKSTLLSILGLLKSPSEGAYFLNGDNVAILNPNEKAKVRNSQIGIIFQAFNLIGDMTVRQNVELPLTYRKDISRSDRKALVQNALQQVELDNRLEHFPAQLSGGQQQRVAIARALITNPQVLLADEPTGNLDSNNAQIIMKILEGLNSQGITICMVTHDVKYSEYAKRQISLNDGEIVEDRRV